MPKVVDQSFALPLKGAHLTRRGALRSAAAAAAGLAAGITPAIAAEVASAPVPVISAKLAVRAERLMAASRRCRDLAEEVARLTDLVPLDLDAAGEAAEAERLGLPALSRRSDREHVHRDRLAAQLASTPVASSAELALKANSILGLVGTHPLDREADLYRHGDAVLAVLRDAVRLGGKA